MVMSTQQGDVREAREMGNVKCRGQQTPPWRWDIEFTWLQEGATHRKIRSEHCSQGNRKRKGPGVGASMACSRSTERVLQRHRQDTAPAFMGPTPEASHS